MMLLLAGAVVLPLNSAQAIGTSLDLGTSGSYSVLAGQAVTNTGPSTLDGDLGVSPGSALTGFPSDQPRGASHAGDANSAQAQSDLTIAYNNAAGQASDADVDADLGGARLLPGVYTAAGSTQVTGTLTLDAEGDPDAVFIFQIGSALTTASGSAISLVNGAQSCQVFWQVGSSATLGTGTTFVGTILALTSISTGTGTTVEGRALARNGAVTVDNTTFTTPDCDEEPTSSPGEEGSSRGRGVLNGRLWRDVGFW